MNIPVKLQLILFLLFLRRFLKFQPIKLHFFQSMPYQTHDTHEMSFFTGNNIHHFCHHLFQRQRFLATKCISQSKVIIPHGGHTRYVIIIQDITFLQSNSSFAPIISEKFFLNFSQSETSIDYGSHVKCQINVLKGGHLKMPSYRSCMQSWASIICPVVSEKNSG